MNDSLGHICRRLVVFSPVFMPDTSSYYSHKVTGHTRKRDLW